MIYRKYGKTGMKVSVIGFGGMRIPEEYTMEQAARLLIDAKNAGINYFDTAPGYGRSEEVFGEAFRQFGPREDYYVSTKSMGHTAEEVRKDVERSLIRMKLDYIDVFHLWCVMSPEDYAGRKAGGVLEEAQKLKKEGVIRHISVSTHMNGHDIRDMFDHDPFEGTLLGCSAINYSYREDGIRAAEEKQMGVVVMNPLGGGAIPNNPERFAYLKTTPRETVVEAALRFLIDDPAISVALVGLSNTDQLNQALRAVEEYTPRPSGYRETLRRFVMDSDHRLCTSCGYCEPCPYGIPIVKFMDACNQMMLNGDKKETVRDRLYWHWHIENSEQILSNCAQCGACEEKCTQKLPVTDRLKQMKRILQGLA